MPILELCAGYGGLALAVEALTGDVTTVVAEVHPAACRIMAQRFPDAPNLGDARDIDWASLRGEVDKLSCGFPCQDISDAGTREGIKGAKSGLWFTIADAIRIIRPRHVYLENVSAIRNRGQSAVLTSLHQIGYDTRWTTLRASDIGAAHRRERWFAIATPADRSRR
jgi:DNA (cytosine-5)-methyltransferase 1